MEQTEEYVDGQLKNKYGNAINRMKLNNINLKDIIYIIFTSLLSNINQFKNFFYNNL